MKIARISTVLLLVAAVIAICSAAFAAQQPEQAAESAATSWLALIDNGNYAQSWDEASSLFKSAVTKQQWQSQLEAARPPLGKVVTRSLKSAKYATSLPGVPDGQYVVIQYDTRFEQKQSAVETLTMMLDKDGQWRAAGYFIR